MIFNYQYLHLYTFILVTIFLSSSTATYCNNLTSIDDKDTPCFLEISTQNPIRLRSSSNSLILPCHVAHSKHSIIEWWYQDFQNSSNIKIYPVYTIVRPTVVRFITSAVSYLTNSNETDIADVSILLRYVNIDDSGIYQCIIRPRSSNHKNNNEDNRLEENANLRALSYHVKLTAPRLCQISLSQLPCFTNMHTTSPTIIDAYQTAFLQCVIHSYNRPVNVFWIVGNASIDNILINDYLSKNQYNGDQLRRIFPLSLFDYSIELTINSNIHERVYSCVIDGATDAESTLFTYIIHSLDLQGISEQIIKVPENETIITKQLETTTTSIHSDKIIAHDDLISQEVEDLREKTSNENTETKDKKFNGNNLLEPYVIRSATLFAMF
ncbi:unnamed protein product [Rotaria sordida]|uniref:Ig-like domain-containing protein n=1 Tax=Rotaria sordida TaxID=392033 RepID=A0A818Q4Z6_9BILA|nr:unnamed protein product [Rotaria sordida]CAF3820388.1 unnamed protein product [Rotaria sordida]